MVMFRQSNLTREVAESMKKQAGKGTNLQPKRALRGLLVVVNSSACDKPCGVQDGVLHGTRTGNITGNVPIKDATGVISSALNVGCPSPNVQVNMGHLTAGANGVTGGASNSEVTAVRSTFTIETPIITGNTGTSCGVTGIGNEFNVKNTNVIGLSNNSTGSNIGDGVIGSYSFLCVWITSFKELTVLMAKINAGAFDDVISGFTSAKNKATLDVIMALREKLSASGYDDEIFNTTSNGMTDM
ncbi:hypothetical protein Tco_0140473 [Tanacetum coccineum]